MKKVKKAVIPAAGLGTRFLPATKAMAKFFAMKAIPYFYRSSISKCVS